MILIPCCDKIIPITINLKPMDQPKIFGLLKTRTLMQSLEVYSDCPV